jgi:hypothetical protein
VRLLMTLWRFIRHPDQKPPAIEHLEKRQDDVERRLDRIMSPDAARHARELVRKH